MVRQSLNPGLSGGSRIRVDAPETLSRARPVRGESQAASTERITVLPRPPGAESVDRSSG